MDGNFVTIRTFYEEAFRLYAKRTAPPDIDISYYPYTGINHTIRIRDGRVFVRIADICRDMPGMVHRALAHILVTKLFSKPVPAQANEIYSEYINTEEMRDRATRRKCERGRKVITSHRGSVYDLNEIFDDLNVRYFAGKLEKPILTWSSRLTYRILGHHDSTHETIVVSRSLDSVSVPRYVVEYIVFHEMLHVFHPTKHVNGRRYNHTPAFRRDERKFKYFNESEVWIERNVRKLKRVAKKSARS